LEAARLLCWRAAWMEDRGIPHTTESSVCKLFAAQVASRACNTAIQIHGGYGYTREFPVERYFRDVRLCEIGEGTNEVQRLIISRELAHG
jgi:alkylation response protein AidB-like acyl-CoA dehydrogenase